MGGTTSYLQQLTETITYPPGTTDPGSPQTVSETLDTSGVFQNLAIPLAAAGNDVAISEIPRLTRIEFWPSTICTGGSTLARPGRPSV
jgi:hypothetical protein